MLSKSVQTSSFFNIIEGIWLFFESLNAISRTNFTILFDFIFSFRGNYYIDPCGLGFQIVYLVSIFFFFIINSLYKIADIYYQKKAEENAKNKKKKKKKKEEFGVDFVQLSWFPMGYTV
jgi:hypothetical protein